MDKNKNRTDLLAAGRKKLQQYRQKKDHKGTSSHGKSSKKSGKSEKHEGNDATESSVDKETKSSLVPEGETAPSIDYDPKNADSSVSHSVANLEACEVNIASDNPPPVVSEAVVTHICEPEPKELEAGEHNAGFTFSRDVDCSQAVDDVRRIQSVGTSETQDSEAEVTHTHIPISVYLPLLPVAVDDMEGAAVMAKTNTVNTGGEESFQSREDIPDISLTLAREDQEAEGSGLQQFCKSTDTTVEREEAGHFPKLNDSSETAAEAASMGIDVEQTTSEENQTIEVDDDQSSGGTAKIADGLSASNLAVPEADGDLNSDMRKQQTEDIAAALSIEEKQKVQTVSDHYENNKEAGAEHATTIESIPIRSSIYEGKSDEIPFEPKVPSSSGEGFDYPVTDVSSISTSQVLKVIRGLGEDEFQLLLKSRESDANSEFGNESSVIPDHVLPGFLEKLKEELFLTNFSKDILQLQLIEQLEIQKEFDEKCEQFVDEISVLTASLNEVRGRNTSLNEELAQCSSELQVVASGREELQNQLHASDMGVQEMSSKAYQLQISLERSQEDLSSLLKELADCKSLVGALQAENDNLNRALAYATEDTRKLEEQKEYYLQENEKLVTEMAEYKNLVAAVQAENSNLGGIVASMTNERNNLEEEKEYTLQEKEKVSKELADLKGLLDTLKVEGVRVDGILSVEREEKKKLEEDKQSSLRENERLLSELLLMQEQLSAEHENIVQVESDLKQSTICLEQLKEENLSLTSKLEMHSVRIREIDEMQIKMADKAEEERNQFEPAKGTDKHNEFAVNSEDVPETVGKQDGLVSSPVFDKPLLDGHGGESPVEPFLPEVYDDSTGFVILQSRLKEAEKTLQNLEKEIEEMHSHSSAVSKSGSKMNKPAVSKLIQAFESKVHQEDLEVVKAATEDVSSTDVFLLTREQTGNMKALLKQLGLDAEKASLQLRWERDGKEATNIMFRELQVQHEALKEHCDNMEAKHVEFEVLYEAVKQYLCEVEAKNNKLEEMYESVRQQDSSLKAENSELLKMLSVCQSKLGKLEHQFHELQQSSDEVASTIQNQLESVETEAAERATILEQNWSHVVAQTVETVGKLSETVGTFPGFSIGTQDELDINSLVSASVDAAIKVIEDLQEKLKAAHIDHEAMSNSYKEVNEKLNGLCIENEIVTGVLRKIHSDLRKLLIDSCASEEDRDLNLQNLELLDPLDPANYDNLMQRLGNFRQEMVRLELDNNKLNSELMSAAEDIEELNRRCLDSDAIDKLFGDVGDVVKLKDSQADIDKLPIQRLENLVSFLVEKYKEAEEQVSLSGEQFASQVIEMSELQEMIHQLNTLNLQHENEILILKENLRQAEEAVLTTNSQLQEKASELEQSEQRATSYREKLSIAVAKGKGLIVQRDSLKQSLAEKSSELERCSQELQLKEARLLEVESELKTYSEAGERVEALESELSYIRNSATALRESFLQKDSVLQRIEEILEDLDLPEHFHSRDIIEKVDWLARSAAGNSLPVTEWDQKSSGGGDSFLDSGFVVMDAWKEDVQPNLNSGDDMRRKYEELQSKFYGLAEQNEMLEQSLMERNNLVQRWEELLDKINMPSHLRSVEPEDRIEWLGSALSEALHERSFLQQKTNELEAYCGSLTADLEDSRNKLSELDADIQRVATERDHLSERLEVLTYSHDNLSAKAAQLELGNDKLQNEVTILQENVAQKLEKEESAKNVESEIRRMQELISDTLKDTGITYLVSGGSSTACLEALLKKLLESYSVLSEVKPVSQHADSNSGKDAEALCATRVRDTLDIGENESENLKKELQATLDELMHVKEERDKYMEKLQSLAYEVEALDRKTKELQDLLSQEEQKLAVTREKLNVAVRKGKSLVQHRDSLKQTIEEMNTEVELLKSEIHRCGNVLVEYEQKIRDLSTYQERVGALESESQFLKNCLRETEYYLQEKGGTLSMILNTLGAIDIGGEVDMNDPVKKLEHIINICRDLREAVTSSEQQLQKSKRAAELLLAELNEVQERNDGLQEDLAKASIELGALSKERDVAEVARAEALLHLQNLSALRSQEKQHLMVLKSDVEKFKEGFFDFNAVLADVFYKDLELLRSLEAGLESCLSLTDATEMASLPGFSLGGFIPSNREIKDIMPDIRMQDYFDDNAVTEVCTFIQHRLHEFVTVFGVFRETMQKHSFFLDDQTSKLSKILDTVHNQMSTQRNSFEAMKRDIIDMELAGKEKEKENTILRKNIATLFEACTSSVIEVENRKAELVRNKGLNVGSVNSSDSRLPLIGQSLSEECIKMLADRLLLVVKDFSGVNSDIVDGGLREMKLTVAKLQKEIQEKDVQKDRISMELVGQIKVAEASVATYLLELQSSKSEVNNLEKQVKEIEEERNSLYQKMMELQDVQASSAELQEKLTLLTNMLVAKDQEIDALMQALDVEEGQMEEMRKKIEELEKAVQQKNLDLENLEASRGKLMKKHSSTVNKFDELHYLSASLIAEVEKLQSQIQDRDVEISFLRQEVTRCTSDVLVASQMSNKKKSDEIHGLLAWFDTLISGTVADDEHTKSSDHDYKEILQNKIMSVISELKDLQVNAHTKDTLLQVERSQIEELTRKHEALEKSLQEKDSQLSLLQGPGDSGRTSTATSEISEVEPLINKRAVAGSSMAPQVRSLRKVNNDQVAIAIDMDQVSGSRLEDEDDDKVHGFKSLTTSRIIPRFTRPVTDMIDGVWVSCDRTLMRQPTFRLGIILYWVVMHALLATFVV